MANNIAKVTAYQPYLDKEYSNKSKSSIFDTPAELVLWTGANSVKLPKISMDGLANHNRNGSIVAGDTDVAYGTYTLSKYRSRRLAFDVMDDEETQGVLMANTLKEMVRTKVNPELDAYRFSVMAGEAGNVATPATLTSSTVIPAIDAAQEALIEDGVDLENCVMLISPAVQSYIKQSDEYTRYRNVSREDEKGINRNFNEFDDMPVMVVPQARFQTVIDLLDGTSSGEEAGGFAAGAASKDINFMIVEKSAILQVVKLEVARIFAPTPELAEGTAGVYQDNTRWAVDFVLYHDCFVRDNAVNGIYLHNKA